MDGSSQPNAGDARVRSTEAVARLRVLASGSGGNCSLLVFPGKTRPRAILIDAGLSPRRTHKLVESCGIDPGHIEFVLLTHLDHDHWGAGWRGNWPRRWQLLLSKGHLVHGRRQRMLPQDRVLALEDAPGEVLPGVRLTTVEARHDEQGVSSFRFDVSDGERSGSLGFATDLGRVPEHLVDCFRGVSVLAIESNYCPEMQMASNRPEFLKRRIMGGSGHLSNQQAADAINAIAPQDHVVLLHLSRDCNHPRVAASYHEGADYALTIAGQDVPSRWVEVHARSAPSKPREGEQLMIYAGTAGGDPRVA